MNGRSIVLSCAARRSSRAFTLLELLAVILVIGLLIALLSPAMRFAGDAARRMNCVNHLKHLGLAIHHYHDMAGHLPVAMGGTVGPGPLEGNEGRLSGLVSLLPYMEQQTLWDEITTPTSIKGVDYPAMGPAPWVTEYDPWRTHVDTFICASDPAAASDGLGQTNYAFCLGDSARGIHTGFQSRGAFGTGNPLSWDEITDGTSNTLAMAEICQASGRSVKGQVAVRQPSVIFQRPRACTANLERGGKKYRRRTAIDSAGRGARWADGAATFSLFNTILPPNSPSCAVGGVRAVDGVYSAASSHEETIGVLLLDASTRSISLEIDAGNGSPVPSISGFAPPSPYGVWGALGTIAGAEDTAEAFE